MHEVEKQTEQQHDPVKTTDPPVPSLAGSTTPSRPPDGRRIFLIAGTVLLAVVVMLAGTLLAFSQRQQPAKQATAVSQPTGTSHPTGKKQPVVGRRTLLPSTVQPIQSQISQLHGSQITVAGSVAYVASSSQAFYALRVADGSPLWSAQLIGSALAPPVVSAGAVYVTTFVVNSGPVYIFALRASDGKQLWHFNTQGDLWWNNLIIDQGIVYTSAHDGVVALRASDGKMLWDTPLKGQTSVSPFARVVGGLLYASTYSNNGSNGPSTLSALRASDGSVAWSYTDPSAIDAPVVTGGVVYSDASDSLLAFRAATGALLWKRPFDGFPRLESLQTEHGTLYLLIEKTIVPTPTIQVSSPHSSLADLGALFSAGVQARPTIPLKALKELHATLYALDSRTGSVRWSYAFPGQDGASRMILDHGMIYSNAADWPTNGAGTGYIFALDSATGNLLWQDQAQPFIAMSAAQVANGVLYVGSGDGLNTTTVYALRSSDGAPLWSYPLNAAEVNSATLSAGMLYLGPTDGIIYALRTSDGKLLWHYQTKVWE